MAAGVGGGVAFEAPALCPVSVQVGFLFEEDAAWFKTFFWVGTWVGGWVGLKWMAWDEEDGPWGGARQTRPLSSVCLRFMLCFSCISWVKCAWTRARRGAKSASVREGGGGGGGEAREEEAAAAAAFFFFFLLAPDTIFFFLLVGGGQGGACGCVVGVGGRLVGAWWWWVDEKIRACVSSGWNVRTLRSQ